MDSEKLLLNFIYLFDVYLESSDVDAVLLGIRFHLFACDLRFFKVIVQLLPSVAEVIDL